MQSFIIALLICSITMSALALIYMAATPLLGKRYSVTGRYYTWLVMVIGLIIPFRPQWSNALIRVDVVAEATAPVVRISNQLAHTYPAGGQQVAAISNTAPVSVQLPLENAALWAALPNIPWWQVAAVVWLAGLIAFLAYHIIKHCSFAKMVNRWSEVITDEQPLALLQSLKEEMGISKHISLYQCASFVSPMMIGFKNPRILLPKTGLSADELHFVLKHELIHYQRKDLYYKCLVLAATAMHWFNPIVYMMARAIEVQCELACDAATIRSTDIKTRQYYSETIISLVKNRSTPKTVLSTNFYSGRKGMKNRIFSIMDMKNKKVGIIIFCVVLAITLGTGFTAYSSAKAQTGPIVGDTINLGGYDWRILEIRDNQALVLSDKILFKMMFQAVPEGQEFYTDTTSQIWIECSLRQYLNEDFYYSTFSDEERERIVDTALQNDSTDKLFILDYEEVVQYFGDSEEIHNHKGGVILINDQFNESRIAETQDGEAAWWWLRTPGKYDDEWCGIGSIVLNTSVTSAGGLNVAGDYVTNKNGGVRPAMWVKL